MEQPNWTPASTRSLLDRHFGAGKVPVKFLDVLDWWKRILADPAGTRATRKACQRDLDDLIGPIAGRGCTWDFEDPEAATQDAGRR